MAKNLKSFRKSLQLEQCGDQTANGEKGSIGTQMDHTQMDPAQKVSIESMMDKYGGKSEAELMDELMRMTSRQKQNGAFDAAAMQKTAQSLMPMLTPEQQQKLIGQRPSRTLQRGCGRDPF